MKQNKGRGLITSFKEWKKLFGKNDGWNKVLGDLATAPPGTRAWPNRTKDHSVSFRIDYGLSFTGSDGRPYRNLELRVNEKSKNPRVAAVANADSNQVLAIITLPADSPPGAGEFMEKLGKLLSFTGSDGHPSQKLELQADEKGKDPRVAAVANADSHRVLAMTTVPAKDSCTIGTMGPSKGRDLITSFNEWKKLFGKSDGWDKVLDNLATAPPGTRAWPNRTKDHNASFRIDYGLRFTGSDGSPYRNLELRVNEKSMGPGVSVVADADSNQVLAIITVPADSPPGVGEFMERLGKLLSFTGSDGHPSQNLELQADEKGKDPRVAAVVNADSHRVLAMTTAPAKDSRTIATMGRGKVQGLKTSFKKWKQLFGKNDGWDKVLDNLATAAPGTRAWPNRTKDHNVSFRIDYGPSFMGPDGRPYRNLDLQANKKTKDPRAAAVANTDSHQVLATITVPADSPPDADEFVEKLGQLLI